MDNSINQKNNKQIYNQNSNIDIPKNILLKSHYMIYKNMRHSYMINTAYDLFNYICSIDTKFHNNIEIEARLGKLTFEGNYKLYEYIKETIMLPYLNNTQNDKIQFTSNIPNQFNLIWYYINKESEINPKEVLLYKPKLYKEFLYSDKRQSFCFEDGELKKTEVISKNNEKKLNINVKHNSNIDYRITAAVEQPKEINYDKDVPKSYREKFRISYKFQYFRVDFTIVKSIYNFTKKNIDISNITNFSSNDSIYNISADSLSNTYNTTFEIEFEFDELFKFLQYTNYNYYEFEKIVCRMIDNINMLINSASYDVYSYLTSSTNNNSINNNNNNSNSNNNNNNSNNNSFKLENSIFGNYFKYNNI